jgi:hypothetical protein
MAKHDKVYDQVAVPSAGGTIPAGKDSANCDDALGKPGRFSKQTEFTAKDAGGVKELREKQLDSNFYQSNGWKHHHEGDVVAPRRGFKTN